MRFRKQSIISDDLAIIGVTYKVDNTPARKSVAIYGASRLACLRLARAFGNAYQDRADMTTDYAGHGCVTLFEEHEHYAAARVAGERP